jgi:protein tyrosine phosphatase (PTP) superfamily phosphohydrolase (DUF442 family)
MRCCTWCFENATVPCSALAAADRHLFDHCRRDARNVLFYSNGRRHKVRTPIFLLRDLLARR